MEDEKVLSWDSFVHTTVVRFFNDYEMEKLTLDDGNGNKAKLSRLKDEGIKIECASTVTL